MITFREVVLQYSPALQPAVNGVSFEALRHRITAVVGPNGSGKSTLVRALLGTLTPEAGAVFVDAAPLELMERRDVAQRIAVITQREEPAFPLPVREYIALGRHPHAGPFSLRTGADREAIERAIARADVRALLDRTTDALSGGEWQRVRIARGLAQGGDGIVLDEPTTFLDVAHAMAVFELLDALAREGMAVLLVSHDLNLVARFADHMILLDAGRVVAAGAPTVVMQADILERVYHWPLVVARDPAVGAPALVPLRSRGTR